MNTNAIRDLSVNARHQLMEGVERRCLLFDVREGAPTDAEAVDGRVLSSVERRQRAELMRLLNELSYGKKPGEGMAQLVERAAYTWFNRLFAIRFMEANDRLPSHVRMLSAPDGSFAPECLHEAMDLPLASLDINQVAELVASGDDESLFRTILLAQCDELAGCMPAVFERVIAAMGLLLPDGLLAPDGVVERLVTAIPEDDWREGVEIVGWAYQFYVSERKDEFFKSKRKAGADDIAPATQLFTPEYIVRFLVQNSLGRLWVLNNPGSALAGSMEYFIKPDPGSHEEFRRISSPEEITLVDPACGSGHFLCYAFDLLAAMYEERGYRRRDVPRLVLEKNLTGIEIDSRAAALTAFALTMKACELDARFLRRVVAPKVTCLESVELTPEELAMLPNMLELKPLTDVLAHLSEVGSLWNPTNDESGALDQLSREAAVGSGLFAGVAVGKLERAKRYAEVLGATYDVCVTNPPYMGSGNLAPWMSGWVKKSYPNEKADLCTCFIARGFSLARRDGYNAQVTMQSWMFHTGLKNMRASIVGEKSIISIAHLGARAFQAIGGEVVQAAATVFHNRASGGKGIYIRLVDCNGSEQKAVRLKEATKDDLCSLRYVTSDNLYLSMPDNVIAYWASKSVSDAFTKTPLSYYGTSSKGIITGDNARFMRLWHEVDQSRINLNAQNCEDTWTSQCKWYPCRKGGSFRKWYGNNSFVIEWKDNGYSVLKLGELEGRNHQDYRDEWKFQPSITWSDINTGIPAFRYGEKDVSESAGMSYFVNDGRRLRYFLGLLNTTVANNLFQYLTPTIHYTAGAINKFPVVLDDHAAVDDLVRECIVCSSDDWDSFETSWGFSNHPLVRQKSVASAFELWSFEAQRRFDQLKANEEELNRIFAHIYHMEGEVPIEVPDDKVSVRRADLGRDIRSLISYAVGCMFGRYSLDKPGLVLANQGDGLPEYLAQVPNPTFTPDADGILPVTDDEYFEDDIVALFCAWLKAAYGPETLEENLRFVADALGGKGSPRKVIRSYFMNEFFKDHCATYSVPSAGKRPIYWLVDSGRRGGFRALVYMHRYTSDLLARVRTDYVHERQERYRSHIAELEDARSGATRREMAAIDRELKTLRAQLEEVTAFEERLHHLADQMIEIDLDDGFKVNYAKFSDVMAKVR